jgi:integrase/recombinase XerD
MRVGEVAALRICDVLTSDGHVKEEVRLSADQTKGDHSRVVYLPSKTQQEVRDYLLTRFKTKDLMPICLTDTSRALFATQKNNRRGFSANTMCQYFHYLYKEVGIDGASSHSGRRGFITNLANKGVSVRLLMELVGHSSMSVTQKYIDVNPKMLRASVELL